MREGTSIAPRPLALGGFFCLLSATLCLFQLTSAREASALGAALNHASKDELADMPELTKFYPPLPDFGEGDIFMVYAHADDELLTIAQLSRFHELFPDRKIHWLMVSDNGKGRVMSEKCLFISKSECRMREARAVAGCMGLEPPIPMGLPDGGLADVPDLSEKIWNEIDRLSSGGKIAAVFSSDPTGLYGHPDHMAVHDAVAPVAQARGIPYVTYGLPELFKEKIPLQGEAQSRPRPDVTHVLELDETLQERLVCAMNSHRSQRVLLWHLRQGLSPEDFYSIVYRSFFNMTN